MVQEAKGAPKFCVDVNFTLKNVSILVVSSWTFQAHVLAQTREPPRSYEELDPERVRECTTDHYRIFLWMSFLHSMTSFSSARQDPCRCFEVFSILGPRKNGSTFSVPLIYIFFSLLFATKLSPHNPSKSPTKFGGEVLLTDAWIFMLISEKAQQGHCDFTVSPWHGKVHHKNAKYFTILLARYWNFTRMCYGAFRNIE